MSITITANQQGTTSLPSFITLSGSTFLINPTTSSQVGTYSIDVICSDGFNYPVTTFVVTVSNNGAPTFASSFGPMNAKVGFTASMSLPALTDPEGQTISLTLKYLGSTTLPQFLSFSYPTFTATGLTPA
jgi:hypothetical protein